MKLTIYPEECCEICRDIVHNHFYCPICKGIKETDAYYSIWEEIENTGEAQIMCLACHTKFKATKWKGYDDTEWGIIS